MKFFQLAIGLLLLCSCSVQRKIDKAEKVLDEHPEKSAEYCSSRFPITETITLTPGTTVHDTLYKVIDTAVRVVCPPAKNDTVIKWRVSLPVPQFNTHTRDTVLKIRSDSAKEAALNFQVKRLQKALDDQVVKNEKQAAKIKHQGKTLIYLWLVIIILALILTRKLWFPVAGKAVGGVLKLFTLILKLW